jgi:hypothetical protein
MQKIFLIACILILVTLNQCAAQRRADRTSSGKAAYGVATVSGNGKIKKVKKSHRRKTLKAKARRAKETPAFRKKSVWAG